MNTAGRSLAAILGGCALLISIGQSMADMKGGNPNPGIAPPDSQPLGLSYSDWIGISEQAFYATSVSDLPSPTVVYGSMVVPPQLLLPSGMQSVPVSMKTGQWFFMPVLFNTWANAPGDPGYGKPWDTPFTDPDTGVSYPTYEAWVRELMAGAMEGFYPVCTIDGQAVENINLYRMQSSLFTLVVPDDNLWGLPAGDYTPGLTDGWFLIVAPMTPGTHTICSTVGGNSISYEITVTPGK